jgi:hypothetical protein
MNRQLRSLFPLTIVIAFVAAAAQLSAQKVDLTGKWTFDVQTDQGAGSPTFTFKQEGEKLTGTYSGAFGEATLAGAVKGNTVKFSFKADAQGTPVEITYDGVIEKDSIKGKLDIAGLGQGTFTGKRQ